MRCSATVAFVIGYISFAGCYDATFESMTTDGALLRVDSAGIELVTSQVPQWTPEHAAQLPATPTLSIGAIDGPDEYQLYDVVDATRLSDGSVVIANAGSAELRKYDAQGQYLLTIGRRGDGPGEFQRFGALDSTAGDSLLTWDMRSLRVSVFDPAGEFVRSFQLDPPGEAAFAFYVGRFGDGNLFVSTQTLGEPGTMKDFAIVRSDLQGWRYHPGGQPGDLLIRFTTGRSVRRLQVSEGKVRSVSSFPIPLEPTSRFAAGRAGLFEGTGHTFEVRVRDPSGQITRIIRRSFDPVPVTSELLLGIYEDEWGDFEDADYRETVREAYEAMPLPKTAAAFDRLLADDTGRLWARMPATPGAATHGWSVFDDTGAWLGDVMTPVGLRPFEVGEGYILGRERDELGVERVVLYSVDLP